MANRLALILQEKRIRQDMLANKLNVTPATISRWGSNVSQPSIENLYLAADFLEVSIADLLYGEAKMITVSGKTTLKSLGTDDAYLKIVTGSNDLTILQMAMLVVEKVFPDGRMKRYPITLMGYTNLYRPTHIALIEVGEIITDCQYATISVENCPADLQLTFLCPSLPKHNKQ